MGAQIGLEYALGGHDVILVTRRPQAARVRVQDAIEMASQCDIASGAALTQARQRIAYRSAVDGDEPVELVVESLPEDRQIKAAVMSRAAACWPQATVATNSSSIPPSELGRLAGIETRIVATHYWNPPLLMPLVEVLGGEQTPATLLEHVAALLRGLGKQPVLVRAEVPGMLWNRLQMALLRECLWLVENGVADPQQLDEVVRDGLARRWRLLGPFETVSLGGATIFNAIAENLFPVLSNATTGRFDFYAARDADALEAMAARRNEGLGAELVAARSR